MIQGFFDISAKCILIKILINQIVIRGAIPKMMPISYVDVAYSVSKCRSVKWIIQYEFVSHDCLNFHKKIALFRIETACRCRKLSKPQVSLAKSGINPSISSVNIAGTKY